MKFKELQKKPAQELDSELSRIKLELLKHRAQAASGSAGKATGTIRSMRKIVARILTIKNKPKAHGTEGKKPR